LDTYNKKIVRVDKLATGGKEDGLAYGTHKRNVLDHCSPAEYVPELLSQPLRTTVKPLNVIQPEGPSFEVNGNLIEWQNWRFRLGFTPREGAVLHDVRYNGRSVLYRLSLSEMTVPYGDPRPPFHRKQAFDFGDAGAGRAANNLSLGCDCLGVIRYFDAVLAGPDGKASISKNVVCLHEQDNGIGWKHTNYRTQRAVVTRSRELVVQFIITLANYEYIFAYKLDQAGGITVETRATGIVSVVNIDPGKTSPWGNVVSAGALAQNHQHLFCIRIDPAIDGVTNTVVAEESLPMPISKELNPFGNSYEVRQTPIKKSKYFDASPMTNLTVKMTNPSKLNPISGKPVGYKFIPSASQLMLAHPDSIMAKRAQFAQHHVWVTKYKDGELWAGGEFTNQSKKEVDGVADAVARNDNVENDDVVVWNVFGLTVSVSSNSNFIC
jgi:primary-amine oxidase